MALGIANTPLINYFFYKQTTTISTANIPCCNPFSAIADGGNGQLVVTTAADLSLLTAGNAITIGGTTNYDGDYSIISIDTGAGTFNISGTFSGSEAGNWELASNTTGANAGDPLDFGRIFFFDNANKVTPQDTYNDRDLTVLNPNPLILDALGSSPPIYLIDNPYYIEIYDKFNNLVATLENYLPDNSIVPTSGTEIANLFSNYGFDTQINSNIYGETTIDLNGSTAVSAGWRWESETIQPDAVNTYSYNIVSDNGLLANPKNEILLRSSNKTAGETVNRFSSILGDYNKYQGLQLGFSIYARVVSGAPQTLVCELIRTRNGVDQTSINVGSFDITATRTQETFLFTVPVLTDANYSNDDTVRFVINFPLNTDFEYGLTGTWLQISADGTIAPSEEPGSSVAGKEFFAESFRKLQSSSQYQNRGLPLAINEGFADVLNETGTIFQMGVGALPNYAASMGTLNDQGPGVELLRDNIIGMTQTNRLIDFLRTNNITQSRHTFLVDRPGSANILDITTGIGAAPNSAWASLAAPRITVTDVTDEFIYRLNVTTLGNGQVLFTFVDQFDAFTLGHQPIYSGTAAGLFLSGGVTGSVIVDWFIGIEFVFNNTNGASAQWNYFYSEVLNNGSVSENAQIRFQFQDAENISYIENSTNNDGVGITNNFTGGKFIEVRNIYKGIGFRREQNSVNIRVVNYFTGFLAYNDIGQNPVRQGAIPPRVIGFSIDGVAYAGQTGNLSTAIVDILSGDAKEIVAQRISETINTSFLKSITIVSLPNNGDIVQLSNDQTDFNLIFWDTDQVQPANPDSRVPIYVQYTTAQSTTDIGATAQTQIENAVMGVPRAADLGLPFTDETEYFMTL